MDDSFTLRIDPTLLAVARRVAAEQHTTVADLLRDGLILEITRRLARGDGIPTADAPIVLGVLNIPFPRDSVISLHGRASGTAAGSIILDVRGVTDIQSIPIKSYQYGYRNVQLVCTHEQFHAAGHWLSAITGGAFIHDTEDDS